jgi:hypothetical protein
MRGKLRAAGECDERATVQPGPRSRHRKAVKREAALAKVAQRHALQQLGCLFQLRLPLQGQQLLLPRYKLFHPTPSLSVTRKTVSTSGAGVTRDGAHINHKCIT